MRMGVVQAAAALCLAVALVACEVARIPTGVKGGKVLSAHGMEGAWAQDCAHAYSVQNPRLVYAVSVDGLASEQLLMDVQHNRTTALQDVIELTGGYVQWTQKAGGGTATIVTKIEGKRLRTWRSAHSDGTVFIDAGHFSGGNDVPWFDRCD